MLQENEDYRGTEHVSAALDCHDGVYRYCSFEAARLEGGDFGDLYAYCQFRDIEFDAGFFHLALLYDCRFERCTFRGTTFGGCRFLQCRFTDCRFIADEEGAPCEAPETTLFACSERNCEGWHELFTERTG